ncbi:MAG: hypothetical protein WBV39_02075 [Rudaea sp.]
MTTTRILLPIALCILGACSRSAPTVSSGTPAKSTAAIPVGTGSACDLKLLAVDDLAGILDKPITGYKPLRGDPQTCYFITGGDGSAEVKVSIRPGMGNASLGAFASGHMNDYAKWQTLTGVGERAVWKPQLNEISATMDNVLCEVSPTAGNLFLDPKLRASGKAYARLGALCNKVFAGYFNRPVSSAPIAIGAGGNVLQTACAKAVQAADLTDIFNAPVAALPPATLNPQSCGYEVPGKHARIDIAVAKGEDAQNGWQMMHSAGGQPYAGLGDKAMHRGETSLSAMHGDVLCSVDLTGTDNAQGMAVLTKSRGDELLRKLGIVCSKVFSEY